ncbi:MAG: hypothetical protein P8R42_02985 [Candidatus Binatia bacterium]|nr:hypothetical protein [Candidatus Binatia bacterium]
MDSRRGTTSTGRRTARRTGILALLAALVAGCGGDDAGEDGILFAGPPGELLPHETDRRSRFLVHTRSGDEAISTILTTRVLNEGPDGVFIVEGTPDGGPPRRLRARETETQIRLEAVSVDGPDGMHWTDIDPAAVLVETPVVRGRALRTRFVRTLEVLATIDGAPRARSITFEGESVRTPRSRETISVSGMELSALAFDVRGESQTVHLTGHAGAPSDTALRLDLRGTEHLVPGIGLVREVLELTILAGETRTRINLRTERDLAEMAADSIGQF